MEAINGKERDGTGEGQNTMFVLGVTPQFVSTTLKGDVANAH